jgi:6-phosphogluconate dehydrogenase
MKIGLAGLGKMGLNLALNLSAHNHQVVGFEISPKACEVAREQGINCQDDLDYFVDQLNQPRIIWMMVPEGKPVDDLIDKLLPQLSSGDILIDGGNSNYRDTLRRAEKLNKSGIDLVDIGTSGGLKGAREGICAMVGATTQVFKILEPMLKDISVPNGYLHTGEVGSGHFTKMIHNGIEYGMMQAIGEGFEILKESQFNIDLFKTASVWNNGSVIRSWLMELAAEQLRGDQSLDNVKGNNRFTVNTLSFRERRYFFR